MSFPAPFNSEGPSSPNERSPILRKERLAQQVSFDLYFSSFSFNLSSHRA
jgi:hypothetical protein